MIVANLLQQTLIPKTQATWLKDKLVREYTDGNFSLTTTQKENMIDTVHTNIHKRTLAIYRTCSNLWNVLIIGT